MSENLHRREGDVEAYHAHQRVCDLRFEHIDNRLRRGDEIMVRLEKLLIEIGPVIEEVKLHAHTLYGQDREGGIVAGLRDTRQDVDRINKTAAAIIGLVTTNIGTLIALAWNWIRHGGNQT